MEDNNLVQELHPGTELQQGKYRVVRKLGQGGFGITYEGVQTGLERPVAIKEFFMKDYCNRDTATSHVSTGSEGSMQLVETFKKKFLKEALFIAQLDNVPHVIRIYDVFEENGTAYYVMEYVNGGSLKQLVASNGALNEQQALTYIRQLGLALQSLHSNNILHLDVKPDNVLLNSRGEAVLIDFGISKRYDKTGSQTSSTPVGLSKGYAPSEQYQDGGLDLFTPATDIYSLGATLFFLLVGYTPPDANEILENGLPPCPVRVRPQLWQAIEMAMQPRKKDRPQSVSAFLSMLGNDDNATIPASAVAADAGTPTVAAAAVAHRDATEVRTNNAGAAERERQEEALDEPHNSSNLLKWLFILLVVAALAAVLFFVVLPGKHVKEAPPYEEDVVEDYDDMDDEATLLEDDYLYEDEEDWVADSARVAEQYRREEEERRRQEEAEAYSLEKAVRDSAIRAQREQSRTEQAASPSPASSNDQNTYEVVEQQPSFTGGDLAVWLANNIHYPAVAEENGIQGRVICRFIVEKDGSVSNVTVLSGVDPSLDKEAVRVIKSMPRWIPGMQEGRPVRVFYTMPINFKLQ